MSKSNQDDVVLQELVRRANSHTQRLRNIDEELRRITSKVENMEKSKINDQEANKENFDKLRKEIDKINKSIDDLKNEIMKLNEKNKNFAKKRDVEELRELFDLLSPVKHEFVTWTEFNRELKKLKNETTIPT